LNLGSGSISIMVALLRFHKPKTSQPVKKERRPEVLARLIRGPYLQVATHNSIIIPWRTDALTRSVVNFGTNLNELSMRAGDSTLTFEHEVKLIGLNPPTNFYYSIGGGAGDNTAGRKH